MDTEIDDAGLEMKIDKPKRKPAAKKKKAAAKMKKTAKRKLVVKKKRAVKKGRKAIGPARSYRLELRLTKIEKTKLNVKAKKSRRTITSVISELIEKMR